MTTRLKPTDQPSDPVNHDDSSSGNLQNIERSSQAPKDAQNVVFTVGKQIFPQNLEIR
jgi:hypothetical protein